MVKIIRNVSLDLADSNVNPWQFLAGLVRGYHIRNILLKYFIKPFKVQIAISFKIGLRDQDILENYVDGRRFKIRHNSHLKIFTTRVLTMVLRVIDFLGQGHNQHWSLFFAS